MSRLHNRFLLLCAVALLHGDARAQVVPADEGVFWSEYPKNGDATEERDLPAAGYCATLDLMVALFGGSRGAVVESAFAYDFLTQTRISLDDTVPEEVTATFGAELIAIDPHPDVADSCRFVLYGGSTKTLDDQTEILDDGGPDTVSQLWVVDVTAPTGPGSANLTFSELKLRDNQTALPGRLGAGVISRGTDVFVMGGVSDGPVIQNDVLRLSIDQPSGSLPSNTTARWDVVMNPITNRYWFSNVVLADGDSWIAYSGQGRDQQGNNIVNVARNSLLKLSTGSLSAIPEDGTPLSEASPPTFIAQIGETGEFRIGHAAVVTDDNIMVVFGGRKLEIDVRNRGNTLGDNNYLTLTRVNSSQRTIRCDLVGGNAGWCALTDEFPGVSRFVRAFRRGADDMVVLTDEDAGFKLLRLNLTAVTSAEGRARLVDVRSLRPEPDEGLESITLQALQYSLIAVCVFLFISLVLRFRQRGDPTAGFAFGGPVERKTGLSPEAVAALPWIKYDADGNHVRVHVKRDGDGGQEEVTELTEEELEQERRADERRAARIAAVREERAAKARERAARAAAQTNGEEDDDGDDDDDDDDGGARTAASAPASRAGRELEMAAAQPAVEQEAEQEQRQRVLDFMGEEQEGEVCAICLLEFEQDELLKRLPCKHMFHDDCIEPWLIKRGDCPLCKIHVDTGLSIEEMQQAGRRHRVRGAATMPAPAAAPAPASSEMPRDRDIEEGGAAGSAHSNHSATAVAAALLRSPNPQDSPSPAEPDARARSSTVPRAQPPSGSAGLPASAPARGGFLDMIADSVSGLFGGEARRRGGSRAAASRASSASAVQRDGSLSSDNPMFDR